MVMSMWEVSGKETKGLVITFYQNIIKEKTNRYVVLWEATLFIKNWTENEQRHIQPFFWGAFVTVGDHGNFRK